MLSNGANPKNAITKAVNLENPKYITLLLKYGAKITPKLVSEAIISDNLNIVKILFDNGANVNSQDEDSNTPLMVAILSNHDDIVNFLMQNQENKINPLLINDEEQNIVMLAAQYQYHDIVNTYLKDININQQDEKGYTPLMYACMNKNAKVRDIAPFLKNRNIDINIQADNWETALMIAIDYKVEYDVIKTFLNDPRINLDLYNKYKETAFIRSIRKSDDEIVKLFLNYITPKQINAQDYEGKTALINAVISNFYSKTQVLVDAGADVNIKDKFGYNALDYSKKEDIKKLLLKKKTRKNVLQSISSIYQ